MNRNISSYGLRESLRSIFPNGIGNGNSNGESYSSSYSRHRRAQALNTYSAKDNSPSADENLSLFSRNRRNVSHTCDSSTDVSSKIGKLSIVSSKLGRNGADDLLGSPDGGKHDYDWLLTPPGTPVFSSSDLIDSLPALALPKTPSLSRSTSASKFSRLSVSQSESSYLTKPARSSSASRSSISSQVSSYSGRSSGVLNASSASGSYTRPSSPITRSPSILRPSTPTSRPSVSRAPTPSRSRPGTTTSLNEKPTSTQNSRPSTPNSRSHIQTNQTSNPSRTISRPSTPTRRNPGTPISPVSGCSVSTARPSSIGRTSASTSRPSSPISRPRPVNQPVLSSDFPLDTPPNLKTTLPGRTVSAGRSRPGGAVATKANVESSSPSAQRRPSSPIASRGRSTDTPTKGRVNTTNQTDNISEPRKSSDSGMRRSSKPLPTAAEVHALGRTTTKKSVDVASRYTDIRSGPAGARALSTTALFPSIKPNATRGQPLQCSFVPESSGSHGLPLNRCISQNGNHYGGHLSESERRYASKLRERDIHDESTRYDTMLLQEDARNTNWLHSIDDSSDQGSIFDCGFECLPEPFAL